MAIGASRRVTIEFLGDDKSASRTAHSIDGTTSKLGDTMAKVGKVAAVGLAAGVAVAGKFMYDAAKAAAEDEASQARLATALKNSTGAHKDQIASVEDWISAQGRALGVADDDLRPALARLASATGDVGEAQKLTSLAMDVSAGSGKSLEAVSTALMKAQNGQVSSLSRLGINTTKANGETISFHEAVKRMSDTFGGQAQAQANTLSGRMGRLRLMFDEAKESLGAKLLPVLTDFAAWFMDDGLPAIKRFVADMRERLTPTFEQVKVAVGVVVAWIKKNWPEISATVKDVLKTILEATKTTVAIIVAIWKKWGDDIWRVVKPILQNLVTQIRAFMKIIRGVIDVVMGLIHGDFGRVWKGIKEIFGGALDSIKSNLKTQLAVFKSLWSSGWDAIKDIGKRAWGALVDGAKAAFGKIVDGIKAYLGLYKKWLTFQIDIARTVIGKVRDVFLGLVSFLKDKVVGGFSTAIGRIGDIWGRLKALAARPVNFYIETVWNNGLRAALDKIPGVDAGGWRASPVKFSEGGWTGPGGEHAPAGIVHADEYVIKKKARQRLERTRPGLLDALNRTGAWPGYSIGGRVKGALRWAHSQDYQPYKWGGMGFGGWDCSGFMSGITNFLRGNPLHRRVGSTGDFPWLGFKPGVGLFTIGSTPNYGGSGIGHMAGTLAGVNVESRGGEGVVIGPRARGFRDPFFTQVYHLGPSGGAGLSLAGNGVGPAFPTGLFSSGLSAAMAIPNFIKAVAGVWDKVKGMAGRGGMWPMFGNAGRYAVSSAKKWGMDKLKSVGAFGENLATGAFIDSMGPAAAGVTQAWNAIEDFDFPGLANGGIVRARRGGTLVRLGEGGRDEIVLPVGAHRGGRTVLEVNVYLDGKALQQSLVKLKRRNGGIALGIA